MKKLQDSLYGFTNSWWRMFMVPYLFILNNFSGFPHKFCYRQQAWKNNSTHKHDENSTKVRQTKLTTISITVTSLFTEIGTLFVEKDPIDIFTHS